MYAHYAGFRSILFLFPFFFLLPNEEKVSGAILSQTPLLFPFLFFQEKRNSKKELV